MRVPQCNWRNHRQQWSKEKWVTVRFLSVHSIFFCCFLPWAWNTFDFRTRQLYVAPALCFHSSTASVVCCCFVFSVFSFIAGRRSWTNTWIIGSVGDWCCCEWWGRDKSFHWLLPFLARCIRRRPFAARFRPSVCGKTGSACSAIVVNTSTALSSVRRGAQRKLLISAHFSAALRRHSAATVSVRERQQQQHKFVFPFSLAFCSLDSSIAAVPTGRGLPKENNCLFLHWTSLLSYFHSLSCSASLLMRLDSLTFTATGRRFFNFNVMWVIDCNLFSLAFEH